MTAPVTRKRNPGAGRSRRVLPRPRVILGSLVLAVFISVLMVQAYINAEFTNDHVDTEAEDQGTVPPDILAGGPIINTTGGQRAVVPAAGAHHRPDLRRRARPAVDAEGPEGAEGERRARHLLRGRFAGGPVPGPGDRQIADERSRARRAHVHPPQPDRAARRGGGASSTPRPSSRSPRPPGCSTSLIRFPYSSKAAAIDDVNWPLVKEAGKLGYLVVVNDTDSEDWQRPGVDQIIAVRHPGRRLVGGHAVPRRRRRPLADRRGTRRSSSR